MKADNSNKNDKQTQLIILALCILIAIPTEMIMQNTLMELSVSLISWCEHKFSKTTISYFRLISHFGGQMLIIPILIIVFSIYPIFFSFSLMKTFFYCKFFVNILKMIFSSPRPFWINPSIMLSCHGGYGNPSGHSVLSVAIYCSLCKAFISNIESKLVIIILKAATLFLIILIGISRIVLAVHSIDQVLFGFFIGWCIFYYFCIIKNPFKPISDEEYVNKKVNRINIGKITFFYGGLLGISIVTYFVFYNMEMTNKYIDLVAKKKCPINYPGEKALGTTMHIIGVVGCYMGFIFYDYGRKNNLFKRFYDKMQNVNKGKKNCIFILELVFFWYVVFFILKTKMIAQLIRVPLGAFIFGFGLFGILYSTKVVLLHEEGDSYIINNLTSKKQNEKNDDDEESNLLK